MRITRQEEVDDLRTGRRVEDFPLLRSRGSGDHGRGVKTQDHPRAAALGLLRPDVAVVRVRHLPNDGETET